MIIKVEWVKTRGDVKFHTTNVYSGIKEYEVESHYWVLTRIYNEEIEEYNLEVVGSNWDEYNNKRMSNKSVRCEVDRNFIDFDHIKQFIHGDEIMSVKLINITFWSGEAKSFTSSVANKIFVMNDNGETIDRL